MKTKAILWVVFIFVSFLAINNCWAQVCSININPPNPTVDDSVTVIVGVGVPTGCNHVLKGPQWLWNDLYGNHHIVLEISHWFINSFCPQWPHIKYRTFDLGKLQADSYILHILTIYHKLIFDTIPVSSSDTTLEFTVSPATSIGEETTPIPGKFELFQNYPNPFNQFTQIGFTLGNSDFVNLTIYDLLGRKIKTLVSENLTEGHKSVIWDGTDETGKEVASGIYMYELKAGDFSMSKKLVLLK